MHQFFTFIIPSKKSRVYLLTNPAQLRISARVLISQKCWQKRLCRRVALALLMDTWPKNWLFLKGIWPHTEQSGLRFLSVYIFSALGQDPCQITSMHKKRKCVRARRLVYLATLPSAAHKDSHVSDTLPRSLSRRPLGFHIFFLISGICDTSTRPSGTKAAWNFLTLFIQTFPLCRCWNLGVIFHLCKVYFAK
jgi:hypothetical protein